MVDITYASVLPLLNQTGVLKSNPSLYTTLKALMDTGNLVVRGFNTDLTELKTAIDNTFVFGLAADRDKYKPQVTIGHLVFFYESDTGILWLFDPSQNDWFPVGAPVDATYLTWTDESARLPNSRNLLAGNGITFDDTIPNERTVNSTGGFMPVNIGDLFMTIGDGNPLVIPFEYMP